MTIGTFACAVAKRLETRHNLQAVAQNDDSDSTSVLTLPATFFARMYSLNARLKKAKARLFGSPTKDIVVPFNLRCDCGQQVSGIRRVSYQITTCSACNTKIYVLPVNVYPATKRVRSEVLDGSISKRLSLIVRDLAIGETDTATASHSSGHAATSSRARRSAAAASSESEEASSGSPDAADAPRGRVGKSKRSVKISQAAAAIVAEEILVDEPAVRLPRASFSVVVRRTFTPFRLLMLSAAVLIAATGWWVVTQRRMDDARKSWRREMDVAEQALEAGDLTKLHDSLTKAVTAAETLRRNDADSRRAASLLLQTSVVQDLSSLDMISVLAACVSDDGQLDFEKITSAAEALKGNWFVFECELQSSNAGLTAGLPLVVNSIPVKILTHSDLLRRAGTAFPQSPLLFGARIESCRVADGGRDVQIELNGNSSVLITTEYHAAQMGFTAVNSPGLTAILKQQSDFVISETVLPGKEQRP